MPQKPVRTQQAEHFACSQSRVLKLAAVALLPKAKWLEAALPSLQPSLEVSAQSSLGRLGLDETWTDFQDHRLQLPTSRQQKCNYIFQVSEMALKIDWPHTLDLCFRNCHIFSDSRTGVILFTDIRDWKHTGR